MLPLDSHIRQIMLTHINCRYLLISSALFNVKLRWVRFFWLCLIAVSTSWQHSELADGSTDEKRNEKTTVNFRSWNCYIFLRFLFEDSSCNLIVFLFSITTITNNKMASVSYQIANLLEKVSTTGACLLQLNIVIYCGPDLTIEMWASRWPPMTKTSDLWPQMI